MLNMTNETLQSILGSKTVSFYSIFAKAIGSVQAAVMLSQAFFWQEKAKYKNGVEIDGEIYFQKTANEWYDETGLTKDQQQVARKHLSGCGILIEILAGLPATIHYRVDVDALVAVIDRYLLEGVAVAVKRRNKKPSNPRTKSGKFRQQEAVEDGNIYNKESSEKKKRGEKESENPQAEFSATIHTPQPAINDMQVTTVEYEVVKPAKPTNPVKEIVEFLNEKADSQFRHTSKATAAQIKARMKDGYTVEDFKAVIEFKADQWGRDAKMSEYLRPTTLFRPSHFEGYLNAAKKALNGTCPAADRPTANTPDGLLKEISEWYHSNPAVWNEAKQYAGVQAWAAPKLKSVVQKYCARQIADGRGGDTFDQHNARIQSWFLTEPKAAVAAPSMNGNGREHLQEPKFRN
jgi:uncharacterized phage protein (TIGR02220 family)